MMAKEIEGKRGTNSRATSAAAIGSEYIPAMPSVRGAHQVAPLSAEGFHMQDADLGLKMGGRFDKVFGNAAFEPGPEASPKSENTAGPGPGAIVMNSLFSDQARAARLQNENPQARRKSAVMEPENTPKSFSIFRRAERQNPEEEGTLVQPFHEETRAAPTVSTGRDTSVAAWEVELKQLIAANLHEEAFAMPGPTAGGLVRCYVKRIKSFLTGHHSYELCLESGDVFLLAARRRKKSKVSSYVISLDPEEMKRDTETCVAKLKANFSGSEYMLWGKTADKDVKKGYAEEQLCVNFRQTATKMKGGPRTMYAVMPIPESQWQPSAADGSDSLVNAVHLAKHRELPVHVESKITMLTTKPPDYDESVKGYVLDFQGRVKESSVKNFQMVTWDHNAGQMGCEPRLQFGRVDSNRYALDFAYPMTVQSAFAAALASIDTKLCCTM